MAYILKIFRKISQKLFLSYLAKVSARCTSDAPVVKIYVQSVYFCYLRENQHLPHLLSKIQTYSINFDIYSSCENMKTSIIYLHDFIDISYLVLLLFHLPWKKFDILGEQNILRNSLINDARMSIYYRQNLTSIERWI